MSRLFLTIATLLLLSAMASAQSGRAKGSTGSWPVPSPPPAASPSPEPTPASSKPSLPKIVDGERIYTSRDVDERLQILKKPTPDFTREARRNNTRGYVILRAILAADKTVKHIEVLTGLPDGLSDKAIEAAKQVKFKPAIKDGKPVSSWVELVYRFQVY
ncbi:MAG TPA: energy transducer TonB [Pyrinomonadaceae bacterium]|nr:energy transducer TonB [Pyrinomonadaceae bacterium]